jgi:hypothetical protein
MRWKQLFVMAFALMTFASLAAQPPKENDTTHEFGFDGCHFKLPDPYGGRITTGSYFAIINPQAKHSFETWIQFYCEKKSFDTAFLEMGMKRSGPNWILAREKYQPMPEEHAAVYQLHNPTWTGAALASDQTTGDPEDRVRGLGFCIASARQVLCGTIEQVMYVAFPEESALPQIIKLLESIEFIDTPASVPVAPSTTATVR